MASLMRAQYEAALNRPGGGHVLLPDGRRVFKVEDLPPDEELAQGDPVREAEARRNLQRDIFRLQERLQGIQEREPTAALQAAATVNPSRLEALERSLQESRVRQRQLEQQLAEVRESKSAAPDPPSEQTVETAATEAFPAVEEDEEQKAKRRSKGK